MVVEVISSRTDSSSRICAINEPVDFERAPFFDPQRMGKHALGDAQVGALTDDIGNVQPAACA
ncbi:Uncharacterised protein [Enterobacter cancerogenus]|uniref:Uncharacterized protein n=1 Tax=Enterobacter cancerogenus TaxID=69218 RepID=A0A484Z010_9ENTR|nr:Uncharacterised protein [Enterobacter cancerogenus]